MSPPTELTNAIRLPINADFRTTLGNPLWGDTSHVLPLDVGVRASQARQRSVVSIVIGSNPPSLQFAEICHASFGSPVECRYMRRMHRSSGFQTASLST